jgi:dimethylargininase
VTIALTRAPGRRFAECLLTFRDREPIDLELAKLQHAGYERALESVGVEVRSLPPVDELPDAMFVEDCAVVLDEVAIITPMGAPSRVPETSLLVPHLERLRRVERITAPARLEGGDVLRVERTLFIGLSTRTDAEGATRLTQIASSLGYETRHVPVTGCLHLKTAVTSLGDDTLLMNPAWVDARLFVGYRLLPVDASEPEAANVLRVGTTIFASSAYPRTLGRLASEGFDVRPLDISELHKAEAGLTCSSVMV